MLFVVQDGFPIFVPGESLVNFGSAEIDAVLEAEDRKYSFFFAGTADLTQR
jgi:hypothetical protein